MSTFSPGRFPVRRHCAKRILPPLAHQVPAWCTATFLPTSQSRAESLLTSLDALLWGAHCGHAPGPISGPSFQPSRAQISSVDCVVDRDFLPITPSILSSRRFYPFVPQRYLVGAIYPRRIPNCTNIKLSPCPLIPSVCSAPFCSSSVRRSSMHGEI